MPGKADFFFMNIPNRPKVAKFILLKEMFKFSLYYNL